MMCGVMYMNNVGMYMNNVENTNLPLSNVHENKAKYVHKIEGVCRSEKLSIYRQ